MNEVLAAMIDFERYPFKSKDFQVQCKEKLDASGVLVLSKLLLPSTIKTLIEEANTNEHLAYYCNNSHNVYLRPNDESLPAGHSRNQTVSSSKGCIMDDQVPSESPLKVLYSANEFRDFLCAVLGEKALYKYDDNLSSVNVHYAHEGQELGWHFDNSAFAITLLIQKPKGGGSFEYIRDFRDSGSDEMNYEGVKGLLNGEYTPSVLSIEPGDLVLFRGRNSVHRVTPTEGGRVRILSVLAYNTEPGVQLSESARMTFYGRLN